MKSKISIIVPVYKVEPYIRRCIDSILSQTFKDFELILVDDGSPDRCGEICEEYALKDSRIKVIHKENGGQASARNLALDICQGEYVGFLDSDDYIEKEMYEVLYNLCIENQADIGVISSRIIKGEKSTIRENSDLKIFDKNEAMKELAISKYFDEVVWTKLFKKETIGEERFKVGIKYEDTDFTYRVVDRCKRLAYIGKPMYNYIIRDGSTMSRASKEFSIDHIIIYEEMYEFYKRNYREYKGYILDRLVNSGLSVLNRMLNNEMEKNKKKIVKVREVLNKYFIDILRLRILNRNLKILLIALRVNINLYKFIIKRI